MPRGAVSVRVTPQRRIIRSTFLAILSQSILLASLCWEMSTITAAVLFTTILQVAVLPLAVLAVITAVPLLSPSTTPFWSTEATLGLLEDQAILAVRPRGFGVAVRVRDSPLIRVAEVTSRVRPVTLAEVPVTVTWQFLLRSPTWAVITALPAATAVTLPFSSTVATASLPLLQVTSWMVAFSGWTAALSSEVAPTSRLRVLGCTRTFFTATPSTSTRHWALAPLSMRAVIMASPAATAVTLPFSTVATASSSLSQVMVPDRPVGWTRVCNVAAPPRFRDRFFLLSWSWGPLTDT